jgi:hypothetical protein
MRNNHPQARSNAGPITMTRVTPPRWMLRRGNRRKALNAYFQSVYFGFNLFVALCCSLGVLLFKNR